MTCSQVKSAGTMGARSLAVLLGAAGLQTPEGASPLVTGIELYSRPVPACPTERGAVLSQAPSLGLAALTGPWEESGRDLGPSEFVAGQAGSPGKACACPRPFFQSPSSLPASRLPSLGFSQGRPLRGGVMASQSCVPWATFRVLVEKARVRHLGGWGPRAS